jgi:hypothetical protein
MLLPLLWLWTKVKLSVYLYIYPYIKHLSIYESIIRFWIKRDMLFLWSRLYWLMFI